MSDDTDLKTLREDHSSGWMALMQRPGIRYILDAFLDSPPNYTGTISNLSRRSGVNERTLLDQLQFLAELGVVELDGNEYTINDDSIVMMELFHLNSALNKQLAEDPERALDR